MSEWPGELRVCPRSREADCRHTSPYRIAGIGSQATNRLSGLPCSGAGSPGSGSTPLPSTQRRDSPSQGGDLRHHPAHDSSAANHVSAPALARPAVDPGQPLTFEGAAELAGSLAKTGPPSQLSLTRGDSCRDDVSRPGCARTVRGYTGATSRGLETEGRRVPTNSPSHTGTR